MIRDRLVVGIRDGALSERLQMDAELTLERAKKSVRQREAVREQQQLLRGDGATKNDPGNIEFVRTGKYREMRGRISLTQEVNQTLATEDVPDAEETGTVATRVRQEMLPATDARGR